MWKREQGPSKTALENDTEATAQKLQAEPGTA